MFSLIPQPHIQIGIMELPLVIGANKVFREVNNDKILFLFCLINLNQ